MKNVINKNTILALMVIGMMCFWGSMNANAQQFNVQGDLVSSYVWRGMYQTGASIQPTLGFSVGNFSLTAWGSTDFDGTSASAGAAAKEIDLTAAYTLGRSGLTVSVADINTLILRVMKRLTTLRQEWLILCSPKHFLCLLHGIPCLQGKIRMRRETRIIRLMLNSTIPSE